MKTDAEFKIGLIKNTIDRPDDIQRVRAAIDEELVEVRDVRKQGHDIEDSNFNFLLGFIGGLEKARYIAEQQRK